jgi:hypothetical protein
MNDETTTTRAHGVTSFPNPSAHHGLVIPNDINPQSPAFRSAQQAGAKLAQPSEGQGGSSDGRQLHLLALARCTRTHGVPNFPEPTSPRHRRVRARGSHRDRTRVRTDPGAVNPERGRVVANARRSTSRNRPVVLIRLMNGGTTSKPPRVIAKTERAGLDSASCRSPRADPKSRISGSPCSTTPTRKPRT